MRTQAGFDVVTVDLERSEASALVAVLDALLKHGFLSTGVLSLLGVNADTLALADVAGAKLLLKL